MLSIRLERNIQFGVREFAMAAVLNGMALHGGLRVYGGTFFVFSDYLKAAIRLSALQGLPVTYVFTHDSIAVGEDGPTHEPIEHLAGLRAMPNLTVFRSADARETQSAWHYALTSKEGPTALVLSRQNLEVGAGSSFTLVSKGAYVVYESDPDFDMILLASGSEVNLAVRAAKVLAEEGEKLGLFQSLRLIFLIGKAQNIKKPFCLTTFAADWLLRWLPVSLGINMWV